jgi:ribonuclease T2
MKRLIILAIGLLASPLPLGGARAQSADLGPQPPGQFDFYVLSLTWVPGFCATHRDPEECGRDLGFALHGLWPESVDGYPSDCSSDAMPDDVRSANVGLFPSSHMIDHEWSKHGTCSGLGAAGFFDTTRTMLGSVTIPPDYHHGARIGSGDAGTVKAAFVAANPNLTADSLVLSCSRSRVSEIHICLAKDGNGRACEDWERAEDNCR